MKEIIEQAIVDYLEREDGSWRPQAKAARITESIMAALDQKATAHHFVSATPGWTEEFTAAHVLVFCQKCGVMSTGTGPTDGCRFKFETNKEGHIDGIQSSQGSGNGA